MNNYNEFIVMISKEGPTKIVNFMTPGSRVLALGLVMISHILKMHYFLKNLPLSTRHGSNKQ